MRKFALFILVLMAFPWVFLCLELSRKSGALGNMFHSMDWILSLLLALLATVLVFLVFRLVSRVGDRRSRH
jgi:hypothetical protein